MSTVAKYVQFVGTVWKLNLAGAMEFRTSFLMTVGMMILNNTVWLFFWGLYFIKFPLVNGWSMNDVMMMQAVSAGGFGVAAVFFGNCFRLSSVVANGELDTYLAQPKPVLLHVWISRMSVSAIGDLIFAFVLYGIFGVHTGLGFVKFAVALLLAGAFFVFFTTLTHSLAFYIGNAEGLGQQFNMVFLTFATYPTDIFRGIGRLLLFTVIPAGFISYLPIGFLRGIETPFMWWAIGAVILLGAASFTVFYQGLKRYGSGNMMSVRM